MATPLAAAVTLGGKGAALSPSVVHAIYLGRAGPVLIDPSALRTLSSASNPSSQSQDQTPAPPGPVSDDSSASAAVLLHKLLLTAADSSSPALVLTATTARALAAGSLDDTALTHDEAAVAAASSPAALALAAVVACCAAPLAHAADAVAALSCEAARWAVPDAPANFAKDEADVATDLRKLLSGSSNLAGVSGAPAALANVAAAHGPFRAAARALHAKVLAELNAPVRLGKEEEEDLMLLPGEVEVEALMGLATSLVWSAHSMCKLSVARSRLCARTITDTELREKLVAGGGTNVDDLKVMFDRVRIDSDAVSVLRGVYDYLLKLREVLAWEAAVAMVVIEMDSSIEKPHIGGDKEASSSSTKKSKGDMKVKKKKRLGKGTSSVLMLLRDHASDGNDVPSVDSALVTDWGKKLSLLFNPFFHNLESLLDKMKKDMESSEVKKRLPKVPKGTRDFGGDQMAIRRRALSIITDVFKMHSAVEIDTPVFELRETLMGKYGEDSKLVYDLADQGGELCSLRYDLTVPFARYLAMNNLTALRRYQIGKVYRRDNPSNGRYREFYQCDLDIAGVYELMEPDFEVIKILTELLDKLDIGMYEIKLNHRKLLDGMLEICGVPPEKLRTVCSSIDKLDKLTFEEVKRELVEEKGVSNEIAEKIGNLVKTRGPALEVLLELRKEGSKFMENNGSIAALNELEILFKALEKANAIDRISFDLSLARGLDYYTGVIYEAVFKGTTQVGSIAAGGRYDNLVGSIVPGKKVPAVGISLGIERVFAIMEKQKEEKKQEVRATETEVLLSILGKDLVLAAELAGELWNAGIKAQFKLTPRVQDHIRFATQSGIPWMVLVGESEMRGGTVKLKDICARREEEIPRKDFAQALKQRLNK